ncbi:hypothetical protein H1230_11325 [Paenibacillus sp. 19GGS1-52]|uniref:hypothetical protein n=1 Tax=Paenibacillus sp. 19GGS1-52 TaxID=2758563 RepID=UPI001EFC1CC0|nr:hypothetical protein [Paenibacillus sp. 19GGS1-52]ULO09305.1 hypothetical protein H1230_11325 [Paenibacillus sp. 19GGS1-52]
MNRAWLIGAVTLLTATSAVILPLMLADLDSSLQQERIAVETFTGGHNTMLDNTNLVDVVGALPLSLPIDSVGWEDHVLSLDLLVTGNDHEPEELYQNMAQVISFAFQETANVNQLLLRIVAEDKWLGSRRLLLAGDIRRQEWSRELQDELQSAGNSPLTGHLKSGFRISESELWKNQFISP